MEILAAQVLNSLLYASVLFLIAGGLSLIYGVMRIVNLAHGSLYALGAFVMAWAVGRLGGGSQPAYLIVLLPVAALVVAVTGMIIEPLFLRPLYRRAEEYQLLITFGLLSILEDVMRFVWGPMPMSVSSLWSAFGSMNVFGSLYPRYNVLVIGLGVVAGAALWAFVYKTRFGVILRATSQDRRMAAALGIDVRSVYVLAFALGCLMAGLAGAAIVPIQGAVLGMGVDALVLSFIVVVIGGLGSLEGALVGALIVGFVRTLAITFFPELELAILYLIAAMVLITRPAGLLGRA
jgi:branched-chain amino acid transport system permease protein